MQACDISSRMLFVGLPILGLVEYQATLSYMGSKHLMACWLMSSHQLLTIQVIPRV